MLGSFFKTLIADDENAKMSHQTINLMKRINIQTVSKPTKPLKPYPITNYTISRLNPTPIKPYPNHFGIEKEV